MEELPVPVGFREFVTLLEQRRIEPLLTARLRTQLRPVSFETGQVVVALEPGADRDITGLLRVLMQRLFGGEWSVQTVASSDSSTIAELEAAEKEAEQAAVLAHPLVQATLDAFPGATVKPVRKLALELAPDDWTATVPPADGDFADGDFTSGDFADDGFAPDNIDSEDDR